MQFANEILKSYNDCLDSLWLCLSPSSFPWHYGSASVSPLSFSYRTNHVIWSRPKFESLQFPSHAFARRRDLSLARLINGLLFGRPHFVTSSTRGNRGLDEVTGPPRSSTIRSFLHSARIVLQSRLIELLRTVFCLGSDPMRSHREKGKQVVPPQAIKDQTTKRTDIINVVVVKTLENLTVSVFFPTTQK